MNCKFLQVPLPLYLFFQLRSFHPKDVWVPAGLSERAEIHSKNVPLFVSLLEVGLLLSVAACCVNTVLLKPEDIDQNCVYYVGQMQFYFVALVKLKC